MICKQRTIIRGANQGFIILTLSSGVVLKFANNTILKVVNRSYFCYNHGEVVDSSYVLCDLEIKQTIHQYNRVFFPRCDLMFRFRFSLLLQHLM